MIIHSFSSSRKAPGIRPGVPYAHLIVLSRRFLIHPRQRALLVHRFLAKTFYVLEPVDASCRFLTNAHFIHMNMGRAHSFEIGIRERSMNGLSFLTTVSILSHYLPIQNYCGQEIKLPPDLIQPPALGSTTM